MSDLNSIVIATVRGADLSLRDLLQTLKRGGHLGGVINQVVVDRLITDLAREQGITATDEELQRAADEFRSRAGLYQAEDTDTWLARGRLTVEDLEAIAENAVLRRKLRAKVTTQEKVEQHFAENQQKYDRARVAHLVVEREGLASELSCQIHEEGLDFTELARKHSIHEESRHAGGNIGIVRRQNLLPAVAAAVFNARAGEVVGPVKSEYAYHLILVHELLPGQLDERTAEMVREELFQNWLRQQLETASVVVKLYDYL